MYNISRWQSWNTADEHVLVKSGNHEKTVESTDITTISPQKRADRVVSLRFLGSQSSLSSSPRLHNFVMLFSNLKCLSVSFALTQIQ